MTKAASIVGIIMIGSLVSQMVNVQILTSFSFGETKIAIQSILDSILPGILSIGIVFLLRSFIKKGCKPLYLVLGVLTLSILLAYFGIV